MVRDFAHVIDSEKALQGFFLTLTPPTRDMETEAVKASFVDTEDGRFRKLQIIAIQQMLTGHRPEMPFVDSSAFKRAKRGSGKWLAERAGSIAGRFAQFSAPESLVAED